MHASDMTASLKPHTHTHVTFSLQSLHALDVKTEADALLWVTQTHELALLNAHEHYEFNAVHCLSALVLYICQVAVLHLPGACPTLNPKP